MRGLKIQSKTISKFTLNLNNITFRKCRYEDLGGVIYVNRKTLPENYSYYLFLSMWRVWRDIFYVAVDSTKQKIIGYCMNKLEERSQSFFEKEKNVKKGHVFSIGVLHEYRRRGIASILLALSMNAMFKKGAEEIFLEVRVSNTPAQRLYYKFNYKIVARIPHYYADGEDCYVMAVRKEDSEHIVSYLVSKAYELNVVED